MPDRKIRISKDLQYYKFCGYGFFKNLRLYEPFLVLFFLSNELTYLQIGFIYTVREVTRNILEIPAGILADSMGRKKTMMASFGLYILSFAVFYISSAFSFFLLAMFIYALGDAFRTGTHKAMIFDYLKIKGWEEQKTHYYGHTRSFSQLGSAISSLLGGFMVFYTGNYRDIFIYTAVPYAIELILIATYPGSLDGLRARFRQTQLKENFKLVFKGFVSSFRQWNTLQKIGNLSMHTGFYRAVKDYLQPVLQALALSVPVLLVYGEKQRTAVIVGIVYFIIYLLTSFASRRSGSFSTLFRNLNRPLNLTLLSGLVFGLLSGVFIQGNFLMVAIVFYILIFINENLRKPMGVANIAEKTGKDFLATTLSAESQLHSLITAILAPIIGIVADLAGLGMAILIVSVVLLLLSSVVYLKKNSSESSMKCK